MNVSHIMHARMSSLYGGLISIPSLRTQRLQAQQSQRTHLIPSTDSHEGMQKIPTLQEGVQTLKVSRDRVSYVKQHRSISELFPAYEFTFVGALKKDVIFF